MNTTILTLLAIIVVAIWGETFVSSKILLEQGMMPADIFFCRFVIAYIGMILLSHKRLWGQSWKHEGMMALAGISGASLYFLTENMALKFSTASNVSIIVGTTPLLTALLLSAVYRSERVNARQILGSIIAFLGLVLVVLNGQFILHLNPLGDILAFSAALSWAVYSLCMKPLSEHYDTTFLTRKVFGYGLITILPWFFFVEPLNCSPAIIFSSDVLPHLLWLSLVASLGCFMLWNWLLPRLGVVRTTTIVYSQCAFTMLFAVIILGERITWMAILGTLILIIGMVMTNRRK